jgi:hypothetical protein
MDITVRAPREVAESLIAEGRAERLLSSKADPTTVGIIIEALGAAANLVTIAVAVPDVRELLVRAVRWITRQPSNKEARPSSVVIVRILSDPPRTITIETEDSTQVDQVVKALGGELDSREPSDIKTSNNDAG